MVMKHDDGLARLRRCVRDAVTLAPRAGLAVGVLVGVVAVLGHLSLGAIAIIAGMAVIALVLWTMRRHSS
jgi:hypothetical protein